MPKYKNALVNKNVVETLIEEEDDDDEVNEKSVFMKHKCPYPYCLSTGTTRNGTNIDGKKFEGLKISKEYTKNFAKFLVFIIIYFFWT